MVLLKNSFGFLMKCPKVDCKDFHTNMNNKFNKEVKDAVSKKEKKGKDCQTQEKEKTQKE